MHESAVNVRQVHSDGEGVNVHGLALSGHVGRRHVVSFTDELEACLVSTKSPFSVSCRYQAADETVNDGIKIGKITLSVQEIGIGIMSNLITFPPAFLIIFFFRKARKMKLRKNRSVQGRWKINLGRLRL